MVPVPVPIIVETPAAPPSEGESQPGQVWERTLQERLSQYDAGRVGEGSMTGRTGEKQSRREPWLLRSVWATVRNLHFMLKVVESQQRVLPGRGVAWCDSPCR